MYIHCDKAIQCTLPYCRIANGVLEKVGPQLVSRNLALVEEWLSGASDILDIMGKDSLLKLFKSATTSTTSNTHYSSIVKAFMRHTFKAHIWTFYMLSRLIFPSSLVAMCCLLFFSLSPPLFLSPSLSLPPLPLSLPLPLPLPLSSVTSVLVSGQRWPSLLAMLEGSPKTVLSLESCVCGPLSEILLRQPALTNRAIHVLEMMSDEALASFPPEVVQYFVGDLLPIYIIQCSTVELPNNGQVGDKHFVHCSEIAPSSEVEMYGAI